MTIRFLSTFRNIIHEVCSSRKNWEEVKLLDMDDDDNNQDSIPNALKEHDWDFCWTERNETFIFLDTNHHIHKHQRIAHFRSSKLLCRKDLLSRSLQRHFKKNSKMKQMNDNRYSQVFHPQTFNLPHEYSLFVEAFRRQKEKGSDIWIMKPVSTIKLVQTQFLVNIIFHMIYYTFLIIDHNNITKL